MKKKASLILSLVLMLSTLFSVNVSAASWPSLSKSAYCEFTAAKTINVYKDTSCKTRGTSSPSKKYKASVSKNDVCYIYKITSSYIQINYPTSSGRRMGYIKRSDLISKSSPTETFTSKGKATTYVSPGGKSYGNTAKNDKIFACGTKDGYTSIIYTAKSGKRAYKFGWVKTSEYNKFKKSTSTTNNKSEGKEYTVNNSNSSKYTGETYTTKTITINATSFDDWCKQVNQAEQNLIGLNGRFSYEPDGSTRYMGPVIADRQVVAYKKVKTKVPTNKQGPYLEPAYMTVTMNLPTKIKYTLHKCNVQNKYDAEFWGALVAGAIDQQVVWKQKCECGYTRQIVWDIPLPDTSDFKQPEVVTIRTETKVYPKK